MDIGRPLILPVEPNAYGHELGHRQEIYRRCDCAGGCFSTACACLPRGGGGIGQRPRVVTALSSHTLARRV